EVEGKEEKVYKLKKSLYGLKQAPRAWYSQIDGYFKEKGFDQSKREPTLYVKNQGTSDILIVALYVDDLVFTGNNKKMIEDFKNKMMQKYEMSDLGLPNHFLVMEIYQDDGGLMKEDGSSKVDATFYRSLVGKLLYLSATRPDIMFAVSVFSWCSKKQQTVAQSSTEAEYVAATLATSQAIWLRRIFEDIREKQLKATTIFCDSMSAIAIAKNLVHHSRTKHIALKHHFIREAIEYGEMLTILKAALFCKYPLTYLVFNGSQLIRELFSPEQGNVIQHLTKNETAKNSKHFTLKVNLQKSTSKFLLAEADEDFADFIFGLLEIPLGTLIGVFCEINYDDERCDAITFKDARAQGRYLKTSSKVMLTDDLVITPLSSISTVSVLKRLKVSLDDVEEHNISIGIEEVQL
ncbi:retrovirus-related pol polyprotein from transposon TNT 1-94, partial [Tanacetum coccineum]